MALRSKMAQCIVIKPRSPLRRKSLILSTPWLKSWAVGGTLQELRISIPPKTEYGSIKEAYILIRWFAPHSVIC